MATSSTSPRSIHGHSMLRDLPNAHPDGRLENSLHLTCFDGRGKRLPCLPGARTPLPSTEGLVLEGLWCGGFLALKQQFGLQSTSESMFLSRFSVWRTDRGIYHSNAAWTKRHLCINRLPYGTNGARPGSSANASREISAQKDSSRRQWSIAAITKSCTPEACTEPTLAQKWLMLTEK